MGSRLKEDFISLALVFLILSCAVWIVIPTDIRAQGPPTEVKFRGLVSSWTSQIVTGWYHVDGLEERTGEVQTFVIDVDEILVDYEGWPKLGQRVSVYWAGVDPKITAPQPQPVVRGDRVEVYGYKGSTPEGYAVLLWESYHYLKEIRAPGTPVLEEKQAQLSLGQVAKIAGVTIASGAVSSIVAKIAAAGLAKSLGFAASFAWAPAIIGGIASALTAGILRNFGVSPTLSALGGIAAGSVIGIATGIALGLGPPGWIALIIGVVISSFLATSLAG